MWCGHTFSGGLHATGNVDRVTKETVPRHRDSNHSADHWATVHAAAYHQPAVWTMSNLRASTNNGIPRARSNGIWDIVAYIYHSLQKCGSTKISIDKTSSHLARNNFWGGRTFLGAKNVFGAPGTCLRYYAYPKMVDAKTVFVRSFFWEAKHKFWGQLPLPALLGHVPENMEKRNLISLHHILISIRPSITLQR